MDLVTIMFGGTQRRRPRAAGILCLWLGAPTAVGCGASRAADGPQSATVPPGDARNGQPTNPTAGATAPPVAPSDTIRIIFTVIPSTATAKVLWGKKLLGVVAPRKPLVMVRPRDSGPLDVVVRADGFLPVQTRVYTFADSKLGVKLTTLDDKKTLLGYREPPPPEVPPPGAPAVPGAPANEPGAVPDAGAAP
jgi:hypothetical protein